MLQKEVLDNLLAGEKLDFVKWDGKKFVPDATLGLSDFTAFAGSPGSHMHRGWNQV